MNYFEDVFQNTAGRNEKIGLSSIKLNHPVLYVLLSAEENAAEIIEKINSLYELRLKDSSDVKYLCFNNNERLLKESLYDLHSGFLRRTYVNSIYRRIYIIFSTNDTDCKMIRKSVEFIGDFFRSVNNIPLIDIFAISDEKMVGDNNKNEKISAVYKELVSLADSCNMIYLLSNFTSGNILLNDFGEHYNGIVLSSILKDCSSTSGRSAAFDEKMFKENCKTQKKDGQFYTIGTKKIDLPLDIIKAVVIREMIDSSNLIYKKNISEMEAQFQFLKKKISDESDELYEDCIGACCHNVKSLAFNSEKISNTAYLTNGDAMEAVFGQNAVDLFYEINISERIDPNAISSAFHDLINGYMYNFEYGFFAAKEFFEYLLENVISEIIRKQKRDTEERERHLKIWFESSSKTDRTLKLGLFSKIYSYPFELAKEYISLKGYFTKSLNLLKIFELWESTLRMYIGSMNIICEKLNEGKRYLTSYINSNLNSRPLVIRENFENYYKNKVSEYIKSNYPDFFDSVYKEFYSLGTEDIDLLYSKCTIYTKKIMDSSEFEDSVYDEIFSRILSSQQTQLDTREKVSEQLYKEMLSDKVYFCNLMFKEGLYETTCFITGSGGFAEHINKNVGQNIFFDEADKTLNLIYMMGAFVPGNLFYAKQYGLY